MLVWLFIIIVVIALYVFSTYNRLVTYKTRIKASIQEIGNQLKRQADLIPNLVASVKGYMKHESKIFKDLTDARKMIVSAVKSGDAQKLVDASAKAMQAIAPIQAVFESTPQLQAAGPTTQLMEELRDTADKLMYSRRTLIDLTADYNVSIVTFPSNLVAKLFNFSQESGLKMPEAETVTTVSKEDIKSPKVDL